MSKQYDGGPAFPQPDETYVDHPSAGRVPASAVEGMRGSPGMSLRDLFAGMAMQGGMAGGEFHDFQGEEWAKKHAMRAYELADAMLAAREAAQ